MSWELIRDYEHEGENGQERLRVSPDPEGALATRLLDEVTKFTESLTTEPNPEALYQARDVLHELLWLVDAHGDWEVRHAGTIAVHGLFSRHLECNTETENV